MGGLIYKELTLFYKTFDKRFLLVLAAVAVFLLYQVGVMAALFVAGMFSLAVAMQSIASFLVDEKVGWDQYQLALPVNPLLVVGSKYLSALCSLAVSVGFGLVMNLVSSLVFGQFNWALCGLSLFVAVALPLSYLTVTLPLVYWFGRRTADIMRIVVILPVCFGMGYLIETGDLSGLLNRPISLLLAVVLVCMLALLGISLMFSLAGYRYKSRRPAGNSQ